ncbi:hypothetical protein GGP72_000676 [Salinibacter ruber]|uniref:Porin domain-containing protein n=1 Tax=Salinibacter ruber TaxID=146919 RepID=A0A9X2TAU6_9BACT|nr:hypothetical protein [Salinibacter ruber]MCS3676768.1 hypothetical protein [Salinibacter ruber]MCS3680056.1 hypothetical protein [Salinibacter ruber]
MSQFTISETSNTFFQWLTASVFALLLLVATAVPAQAQMEDGELPEIDFSVNLMQSAQYISEDIDADANSNLTDDGVYAGFHQIRAGLTASVQFSENVSGLLMLQQEPNDFGTNGFSPAVDFAVMNLQVSDALTVQAGTPVTGLVNFRGFSDGPVVQGNPLIGNSAADMITAAQGVKLIYGSDAFGFDLTVNTGFGGNVTGDFTTGENGAASTQAPSGINVIGKARYTGSDVFKVGGGIAVQTGDRGIVFANGDRENYNFPDTPKSSKATNAAIPNEVILQGDAKVLLGGADIDAWVGYGSGADGDATATFGGLGVKFDVNEDFHLAGRFSGALNNEADDNGSLGRFQAGFGYEIYDTALLKVEGVRQTNQDLAPIATGDGAGGPGSRGNSWYGVLTELSFNF